MSALASTARTALARFALVALSFYVTVQWVFLRRVELLERDLLLVALTIDLVLVVPGAFYLIVVRRLGWARVSVLPVLLACVLVAGMLLPAERQTPLRVFEFAIIPLELGLLGWVFWRLAIVMRSPSRSQSFDAYDSIRQEAARLVEHPRIAAALATELALFWYAFASWRAGTREQANSRNYSYHRRGGQLAVVIALCFLLAVETMAVHLLLRRWSEWLAWALSLSSLYLMFWLIANARAAVLRPIRLDEEHLTVRCGLGWSARIRRADIAAVVVAEPELPRLSAAYLAQPRQWLLLRSEYPAEGPYGMRREIRAIGIAVDEAADLASRLEASAQ